MNDRYSRNIPAISPEEQAALADKRVLILGCGGLGGYILEALLRMGTGHITAADGDRFDATNLNRQLLATAENIGCPKADAAAARAAAVNPRVSFRAVGEFFTEGNAEELLSGHHLVMDALDDIPTRLLLEKKCAELSLPIIHGAVSGWHFQVAAVPPGSGILSRIYGGSVRASDKTTLPMTAQCCAAIQCAEAVKLLCRGAAESRLIAGDLQNMSFENIRF